MDAQMLQTYRMSGDSSLVVIGESSFQIGLYFIHYDPYQMDFQTPHIYKKHIQSPYHQWGKHLCGNLA